VRSLGLDFFTRLHLLVLAILAPLWWLACRREEQEMQEAHGEAHIDYQARTSMFIPGVL
jgi:protein-S-isoprenylcysteine O-methyltransferase Ste14